MSVQYTGSGEGAEHWGMFSTLNDITEYTGGLQYTGGYPEYTGDILQSTLRAYHEYTRGCSVHLGFHTNSIIFLMAFPHIYHDIPNCTNIIQGEYALSFK